MTDGHADSPVSWYQDAPLLPAPVHALGHTLVVAPHPDDEVLGCGGTIALLRAARLPVQVVIVSDGAASHPGSVQYPPTVLAALRRAEALAGLARVGVEGDAVAFLDLPDGAVPYPDRAEGARAVQRLQAVLRRWPNPQTVLLPWRRDPHGDHRAAFALATAVLDTLGFARYRLEYPIWARVGSRSADLPRPGEARIWRTDIHAVSKVKREAILEHRSQTTRLIDDATITECLTDDVLARFAEPYEPFLEVTP